MRLLKASLATFCFFSFLPLPTRSATIAVCDEAGLRAALLAGGDISFACDGTITLSNTIVVNASATLDATSRDVTISGGGSVRVFQVSPGVTFGLKNLKVVQGFVRGTNGAPHDRGGPADGAGIYNFNGVVFATDCRFLNNQSVGGTGGFGISARAGPGGPARGAALFSENGQILLTNCVFSNNITVGGIGGAHVISQSQMGPGGFGGGGAVGTVGGEAWLINCLLVQNKATATTNGAPAGQPGGGALGGALYAHQTVLHMTGTTFRGNISEGGEGAFANSFATGIQPGTGGSGYGGAIYSGDATLLVTNSEFASNRAAGGPGGSGNVFAAGGDAAGGMLYASNGAVAIAFSTINGNLAVSGLTRRFGVPAYGSGRASGGAVFNAGTAVQVAETRLINNSALAPLANAASGGAVYQTTGTLALTQCILGTNSAIGGGGAPAGSSQINQGGGIAEGGAIHVAQGLAAVNLCALVNNTAAGGRQPGLGYAGSAYGGAIFNRGLFHATNSTFADNVGRGGDTASSSFGFSGGSGYGAGVFNASGTSFLSHVTIALNHAQPGIGTNAVSQGGGIFSTNGSVSLYGSILAHNAPSNCFGSAITDSGFNISSDFSCPFSGTSQPGVEPFLGPLDDYGGGTLTMALVAGSPALDAAAGANSPALDQRGRTRPSGPASDIGAFESSPPFTLSGHIVGPFVPAGISVTDGAQTTVTDAARRYRFNGLAAGNYTITPSAATHLIIPANRSTSVGPDVVDVDFRGYRWNSMNVEELLGNTLRLVYAGTNGDVVRIQSSSDLGAWTDHSTNSVGSDGLFETPVQKKTGAGGQYFRAINP